MVEAQLLSETGERNRLVGKGGRTVANGSKVIERSVDEEGIGSWIADGGDRRITATERIRKHPIGTLHGQGDDALVYPLLDTGKGPPVAGAGGGGTEIGYLLTCSGNRITGYTQGLSAAHRAYVDVDVGRCGYPHTIPVK